MKEQKPGGKTLFLSPRKLEKTLTENKRLINK